ncbi:hypothetical protein BB559_006630 [Furculomyces boomerangus]|uniref:GST N-terminal domain-containing protein n=1 Tax=Furculomyces boomerangus TaxID=61424 RepID=A0A2T9Y1C6_9FUNG|nr:hypothetical protein BB559_006630 [Furculomyces boomerangus]
MDFESATLAVVNYRYSSWSFRGWAPLKLANLEMKEVSLLMEDPNFNIEKFKYSPTGLFPTIKLTFKDGSEVYIHDSLSVAEFANEYSLEKNKKSLWPQYFADRAVARSAACEMHSGFSQIRTYCNSNFVRHREFEDRFCPDEVKVDLKRIYELWNSCRKQFLQTRNSATLGESAQGNVKDEGFLFGEYGIVDAFFTPVVFRIVNYSLPCEDEFAKKYIEATKNHSLVKEWLKLAVEENSYIKHYEEF